MEDEDDTAVETLDPSFEDNVCSICYAEFLEPEDLTIHLSQVHVEEEAIGSYICSCQFCSAVFVSTQDYAIHIRDVHLTKIKSCKYCNRVFLRSNEMTKHEKKHKCYKRNSEVSCSQCPKFCADKYELNQHEYENHSDSKDGILLNDYLPLLSSVLNIKAITFIKSLDMISKYVCTQCYFKTNQASKYIKHCQDKKCVSLVCDKCSSVFKSRRGLREHFTSHSECGISALPGKECKTCHKIIKAKNFAKHTKKCQLIKCNICNIILKSMYELSEHQTKNHPLALTMQYCTFCNKEFIGTVALEKHIKRVHSRHFHLYKYKCLQCDKYFTHPRLLFGHYFSTHKDLQPYSCKICDLKFRVRKSFTIHIKLKHESKGFVEFDENFHVFFTAEKSPNPFVPTSFFASDTQADGEGTETEAGETDIQTDADMTEADNLQTTDLETDVEKAERKKPPKMRFKKALKDKNIPSESENDTNSKTTSLNRRQSTRLQKKSSTTKSVKTKTVKRKAPKTDYSDESDYEPPNKIKNKMVMRKGAKHNLKLQRKQLTCPICEKYCYTKQNYDRHMNTHKNKEIKCIKCDREFKSNADLTKHIERSHSSSKLTETLKNLLERRKSGKENPVPQLTIHERFKKTIKKVSFEPSKVTATIKEASDLSVQKFIESFTPDETNKKQADVTMEPTVTVKTVSSVNKLYRKKPLIKMTKFTPPVQNNNLKPKLAMPVRFKGTSNQQHKVRVKLLQTPTPAPATQEDNESIHNEDNTDNTDFMHYEDEMDIERQVPEVGDEVMLEAEKPKMAIQQKLVIPDNIKESDLDKIRIAHLFPEAPFFKIVKINEVLVDKEKEKIPELEKLEELRSSGPKLVNVNPLAHLLGDKNIDALLKPSKPHKNVKPKLKEVFECKIAQALMNLESPNVSGRKKRKKVTEPVAET